MLRRPVQMIGAAIGGMLLALSLACSGPTDDIRTVADFDANPCALIPQDILVAVVAEPYRSIAQVAPTLKSAEADDTASCVYSFEAPQTAIPQMATFTVTVSHMDGASQPLAICAAGAKTNNPGYKMQDFGDLSCTSPTSDLWLRKGEHFYHVVVVAQPGFVNPVDRSQALSPMIIAVGRAAADRLPKS